MLLFSFSNLWVLNCFVLLLLRGLTNPFQKHQPPPDYASPRDEIVVSSAKGQMKCHSFCVSLCVWTSFLWVLLYVSISYKNTWESRWWGRWWCVASWSTIMSQQRQMFTLYTFQKFLPCFFFYQPLIWSWFISRLLIMSLKDVRNRKLDFQIGNWNPAILIFSSRTTNVTNYNLKLWLIGPCFQKLIFF